MDSREVSQAVVSLDEVLSAIEAGEVDASNETRLRVEGALVALSALIETPETVPKP